MFSSLQTTSSSSSASSSSKGNLLGKLPDELLEKIVGNLSLMSWDEAKKHREELMKERKYFVEENSKQAFEREFSLCEH
jgi:Fe-S cluster biosynthesis and repair protein YggX